MKTLACQVRCLLTWAVSCFLMSYHQQQPHASIELPDTLNSAGAKLLYFYLQIEEDATVDELQTALGLKKVTIYSLLQTLTATGLVEQSGTTYSCQEQITTGDDQ